MQKNSDKIVVGVCGFASSGKNTFANLLIDKYNFIPLSFASCLKDIISTLFDWDRHLLEGDTEESRKWRETVDDFWTEALELKSGFTPRKALQQFGTEIFRNCFNENIWVLIIKNKILKSQHKKIIITDFRFENEFKIFHKSFEFFYVFNIVRVVPNEWWYKTLINEISSPQEYEEFKNKMINIEHQSEFEWIWVLKSFENLKFFKIYNTKETLEEAINDFENNLCEINKNKISLLI
jgi:hypothetical protein